MFSKYVNFIVCTYSYELQLIHTFNWSKNLTYVKSLVCRGCFEEYPIEPLNVCEMCFGPLEITYDYESISKNISREIIAGKGHGSMDPLQLHFGLGENILIDGITVKWPSKDYDSNAPKTTYYEGPIDVNQSIRIVEDIGLVGIKGDITNDNNVNIFDILEVVNIIL